MGKLSRSSIIQMARKLRKSPTDAEEQLWAYLRNRKLNGLKFLRQHPIIVENNKGVFNFSLQIFIVQQRNSSSNWMAGIIIQLNFVINNEI